MFYLSIDYLISICGGKGVIFQCKTHDGDKDALQDGKKDFAAIFSNESSKEILLLQLHKIQGGAGEQRAKCVKG